MLRMCHLSIGTNTTYPDSAFLLHIKFRAREKPTFLNLLVKVLDKIEKVILSVPV